MTDPARRLPYSTLTWAPGWARADAVMDSTGVMPDPAAMSTCRAGASRSAVNDPAGGWTSIRSPGRTSRTSQPDMAPPGTSRTPIRGGSPAGEQMEYGPALIAAVDHPAQGERLAGPEPEQLGVLRRNVEGDGGGIVTQPVDAAHGEFDETAAG